MPTNIPVKFLNSSDSSYTQVLTPCDDNDTSIRFQNLQAWNVGDKVLLTLNRVTASGESADLNPEKVYGEISTDNWLINCVRGVESSAKAHGAGEVAEDLMTSTHFEALREGLKLEHNDDGAHSSVLFSRIYPIGSVYINADVATNPASLLGFGTWVAWGVGRAIVGIDTSQVEFDTPGEVGGAKTHTLTASELAQHYHTIYTKNDDFNSTSGSLGNGPSFHNAIDGTSTSNRFSNIVKQMTDTAGNDVTGGAAHNNLQPYQVGYVWKRTA